MTVRHIGEAGRNVAANVRYLRYRHDMTLKELAALMTEQGRYIPAGSVACLEQGRRHVDVDDLVALAAIFGVSIDRLVQPDVVTVDRRAARHDL